VVEIFGENSQKIAENLGRQECGLANFGAQEFEERISRLRRICKLIEIIKFKSRLSTKDF
jgi:hypothetical protein